MNINVKKARSDFWVGDQITAQVFDETSWCCGAEVSKFGFCTDCKDNAEPRHELIYCNHDGADYEDNTAHGGTDNEYTESILVCDKCEAFKRDGERWEDAPFEGLA